MNREIKLRAFATDTKEMIPFDEFMIEWFSDPETVIMQYTGLKDKNGKEIWEGDIVKQWEIDSWDKEKFEAILTPTEKISFIVYESHGFWVKDESFGWEGENLWDWEKLEVIGNIFENPDLLNSDKNVKECDASKDDSSNKAGSIKENPDAAGTQIKQ